MHRLMATLHTTAVRPDPLTPLHNDAFLVPPFALAPPGLDSVSGSAQSKKKDEAGDDGGDDGESECELGCVVTPGGALLPATAADFLPYASASTSASASTQCGASQPHALLVRGHLPPHPPLPAPTPAAVGAPTVAEPVADLWSVFMALLDLCQRHADCAAAAAAGGTPPSAAAGDVVVLKSTRIHARSRAAAAALQKLRARYARLQDAAGEALARRLDLVLAQARTVVARRQDLDAQEVELLDELYVLDCFI